MKRIFTKFIALAVLAAIAFTGCKEYKTVENDPLNARIYTLDNGLKVYMTVNKETPRIQTYIAVRVGAKNDPSETTGLAHYFEHLMFKGSEQFGTMNYEQEKPLLDAIEAKFEVYRTTKDSAARVALYAEIDSLSYEASKLFIPNEYDKLMSAIGAKGTNAYTGYDMTVYVEDIPSNQVENWAKIQADRFKHNVIRGFHTELETVYEEKNMSLTNDMRKVIETVSASLFKKHPYGLQTVLGTQEHLKNPSITNIKNYYRKWYVPNNMAICLSGDFDPDQMIQTIKKYFGDMEPNKNLEYLKFEQEDEIESPIQKEVVGLESPYTVLAWRFPGEASHTTDTLNILSSVLFNGKSGLIDLDINQAQKALGAQGYSYGQADYTAFMFFGFPKQGQGLEEVKGLIMDEIEKLKAGDFSEEILKATINNYKKQQMRQLENNSRRADMFVSAFINGQEWSDAVGQLDRISKLTKEDIVNFANKYFRDNNYVQVNKIQGVDNSIQKISKPKITPILTNRDTASLFLREIQASEVKPIEPVFVDFSKDMQILQTKSGLEVLYKQNTTNSLYSLTYKFEFGENADLLMELAADYLDYLGTDKFTANEKQSKLYELAADVLCSVSDETTSLTFSGLDENMEDAVTLIEELILNAKADENALMNLKADILKERENSKHSQKSCYSALNGYSLIGKRPVLSNKQIMEVTSDQLLAKVKEILSFKHTILYYGPDSPETLLAKLEKIHYTPEQYKEVPANKKLEYVSTPENEILIAPYNAKQIYMSQFTNLGGTFNPENAAIASLYNNYFGNGMNAIVFQEMREARGLAYSARAQYISPSEIDEPYIFTTFIATQNDKLMDAATAFEDIINNMPQSEAAFKVAKENMISSLRSHRTTKSGVLGAYLRAKKLGLDYDINKTVFEKVQNLSLADVVEFQQNNIKGRKYRLAILGDEKDLDLNALKSLGYNKVTRLSLEDIFGY